MRAKDKWLQDCAEGLADLLPFATYEECQALAKEAWVYCGRDISYPPAWAATSFYDRDVFDHLRGEVGL